MFYGPLLPLGSHLSLVSLLANSGPGETIGAWIRRGPSRQWIYQSSRPDSRVLASPDLGLLLNRCERLVVRQERRPVLLHADTIIRWRALQVATATPYLTGIERLRCLFPGLQSSGSTVLVPLNACSPEEVLSGCLAEGLPVTGSCVVYTREVDSVLSTGLRS